LVRTYSQYLTHRSYLGFRNSVLQSPSGAGGVADLKVPP